MKKKSSYVSRFARSTAPKADKPVPEHAKVVRYPLHEGMTLGSDPELMLFDMELNRMASAIRVLGNNKDSPIDLGSGCACYADNVMIEATIPPAKTGDDFIESLRYALQKMQDRIGPRYRLVACAAHEFHPDELADPKAKEIGCTENLDAYTGAARAPGEFTSGLRTGSFHLHIGYDRLKAAADSRMMGVKLMDAYVGAPSVCIDTDPGSVLRRTLYGKAGEYRGTPYGIEYRVLGNYFLRSPELVGLVVRMTTEAMRLTDVEAYGPTASVLRGLGSQNLWVDAINNGDYNLARTVVQTMYSLFSLGIEILETAPPDLYRDWKIKIPKA